MTKPSFAFLFAVAVILAPAAWSDQGGFSNSGGSGSGGSGIYVTSNVAAPAGSLTLSCPGTSPAQCAGGSYSYVSSDLTTTITAVFTSGTYAEGCSGGGKGGHVSCSFTMTGYFSGSLTVNGQSQAINGVTSQVFTSTGADVSGISAYNSAYTPFYYSDSESIHRSDDLLGTNQVSFSAGFYGAYGLALDSAGRIYVADTYNCRIARFDDMNGANLTFYGGTCGAGTGQFSDPSGIAVGPDGKIYVLDTNNSRVIRIDDMNGTNWTAFGSVGSGVGQFAGPLNSMVVDAANRIYIADTANLRIVRMDDMNGTNWTTLTQSPLVNGVSHSFVSPAAVALDSAGRIYVADDQPYQSAVVRVDDMTGANWTTAYTGIGSSPNSIGVDPTGIVFLGGGGARLVDNMTGVLTSSSGIGPIGSYYVFGVTPIPLANPRPSALGFSPSFVNLTVNVGTVGTFPVTVSNFGGSPFNLTGISVSGGFTQTNTCPSQLTGGASCTISIRFAPTTTGTMNGTLSVTDDSGNLGGAQSLAIAAEGTAPVASFSPLSLSFSSQVVGTTSNAKSVTVQNTGTGPMQVTGVAAAAPFSQSSNCVGNLAPGSACTVSVTFAPTALGAVSGALTFTDNAGTGAQTVNLSGTGGSPASLSTSQLEFNTVVVGITSAAKTVTLTNRGSAPLTINSVVANSAYAVASNTCPASLAAGANCTVGVTFTPTSATDFNGTLSFTDSALGSPQTVSLQGSGSAAVSLSPSSLNLGSAPVGSTSPAKTVTLTNHLATSLTFTSIVAGSGFAISSNTCGTSLAAGANCTVGVTFTPAAVGSASGTLVFTDSAPNSPQTVTLSGTGTSLVSLSATSLSFGTVTSGTTSSAKTVTLTNHLFGPLTFTSITAGAPFTVASNTCGSSVKGGGSCTVGVTFNPTAVGAVSGTLTFTDSAGTQTVTLSGTGK